MSGASSALSSTYGGLRRDRIEPAGHGGEQVAVAERHVKAEPLRVGLGDRQRVRAALRPDDVEVGALGLQRERDRAGARADVAHARARRQVEHRLDQVLGLRARDQHARVDRELDRAEPLAPRM